VRSSSASPMTSAELKAIDAKVGSYQKRPTQLGITQATKGVPKNKTYVFVYAPDPGMVFTATYTKEAVTAIGWKYKGIIVTTLTPQGYQAAFNIALQGNPSVIATNAIDPSEIAPQVAQATQRHIPIIIAAASTAVSGGTYLVTGVPALDAQGALQADSALFQTHGNAHVAIATTTALPAVYTLTQGFLKEWKKMCAKCATPLVYNAPVSSFGTNFPSLVSAYVLAHPQINFMDWGFSEMLNGVPNAFKAAGLATPKGTTLNLDAASSKLLLSNSFLQTVVGYGVPEVAWIGVDTAIRLFDHQSIAPDVNFAGPASPFQWIVTAPTLRASHVNTSSDFPLDANYKAQFLKLWGVK
jgi:ABC-type sugar transport system substrate-binding protein